MNIEKYKASKNFDMDISLNELIKHNKTCKINLDSTHHFESYEGILVYVSYPGVKERFTIQLGVDEDGIVYEGDYGCQDSFQEIPIEEGLGILLTFRELLFARNNLERILIKNRLSKDVVKIKIE